MYVLCIYQVRRPVILINLSTFEWVMQTLMFNSLVNIKSGHFAAFVSM